MFSTERRWRGLALPLAIAVLLAAPLLLLPDIPLFDLPVHIARQHILYDDTIGVAREHYQVLWRVLPNLALDLFVGVFHYIMPIDAAVHLFLAVTVVLLFLGVVAVNRALFGAEASFGWYACLLVFSGPFLIGLINLCCGIGLCLCVFALSLVVRRVWLRVVLCGGLAILVLLAHLYAFATLALLLGTHAFGQAIEGRQGFGRRVGIILAGVAPLLLPIVFYLVFVPRGFNDFLPLSWDLNEKIWSLLSVLGVYNFWLDLVTLAVILYGLLVIRAHLVLARHMIWPILALSIAFLVLPNQIGQASWVDQRVPATLALVLFASLDWRDRGRTRLVIDAAVFILFAFRLSFMSYEWAGWQPVFAEYRAAFLLLEPGAKLLPINTHSADLEPAEHPPLPHMDAFAVAERGAFIPTILADRPYELLHYAPADAALRAAFDGDPRIQDYDYVLLAYPGPAVLPSGVTEIYRGSNFLLGRVDR
jgi:hypothetical protein